MKCRMCDKEVKEVNKEGICIDCHNTAVQQASDLYRRLFGEKPEGEIPFIKVEEKDIKEKRELKINKVEMFELITMDMCSTYKAKNHDYGDSFSKQFEKFGLHSTVMRLSDKIYRLETLANKKQMVKDEGILDTLLDIANYSVMTVIELISNKK